ncbi:MAG: hypothetical protein ACOYXC_12245, partial [Candidatus Rifleibacteriota bacterium]
SNKCLKNGLVLMVFFFVLSVGIAGAAEIWQYYRINAQYRGTVKKSFSNIGCSLAYFKDIAPNQSQVIAHVCVETPEKKKDIFAFRTNLTIDHNPTNMVVKAKQYDEYEGVENDRREEVKQLVCLWDMVRRNLANPAKLNGDVTVAGRSINLKIKETKKSYELSCSSNDKKKFSGKFFIEKGKDGQLSIDKFRFQSGRVSVSLIQDTGDAVSKDFRSRQPYAKFVFDNK